MLLFDLQNEIQPWTKTRAHAAWHSEYPLSSGFNRGLDASLSHSHPAFCRSLWEVAPMEWGVMTSFSTRPSLKEMERENSFYRCVLYCFGTFCKKKLRFFVRLPNSECCETTIALELPSYPNNPNSSKGFSSHLSLIPAWQSTSSCSKQNWKADLKGCFEVRGLERRGGKAMTNLGISNFQFQPTKRKQKRRKFKSEAVFVFWISSCSRKNMEHTHTCSDQQKKAIPWGDAFRPAGSGVIGGQPKI